MRRDRACLAMQEKLAKADGSFTSLEKTVMKIMARLDGLAETDTQLPDSLEEALLTECDAFAEALDKVADEIVVIDADTSASLKLVGWLRIARVRRDRPDGGFPADARAGLDVEAAD